jgi:hypothetical protein
MGKSSGVGMKNADLLCVPWWYGNKKEVKATLGNHLSL